MVCRWGTTTSGPFPSPTTRLALLTGWGICRLSYWTRTCGSSEEDIWKVCQYRQDVSSQWQLVWEHRVGNNDIMDRKNRVRYRPGKTSTCTRSCRRRTYLEEATKEFRREEWRNSFPEHPWWGERVRAWRTTSSMTLWTTRSSRLENRKRKDWEPNFWSSTWPASRRCCRRRWRRRSSTTRSQTTRNNNFWLRSKRRFRTTWRPMPMRCWTPSRLKRSDEQPTTRLWSLDLSSLRSR